MTGINVGNLRADLADRCLPLPLVKIADGRRTTEDTLKRDFERQRPQLLGALLQLLSECLGCWDIEPAAHDYRLQGFAKYVAIVDWLLGTETTELLLEGRRDLDADAVDGSPVGAALLRLLSPGETFEGTAAELQLELEGMAGGLRSNNTFRTAQAISQELQRLEPALAQGGFVVRRRKSRGQRLITIERAST